MGIEIRPHDQADESVLHACTEDPLVAAWIMPRDWNVARPGQLALYLERHDVRSFALVVDDQYSGWASLEAIDPDNCSAELRIVIARVDAWGRGVGREAGSHLLAIARRLGLTRLTAEVDPSNRRACALAETLGFDPAPDWASEHSIGLTMRLTAEVAA